MPDPSSSTSPDPALADYHRFLARIDGHADRVETAHDDSIACGRGCSGCCHRQLSVFPVEAANIRASLGDGGLPFPERRSPPPALSPRVLALLDLAGPDLAPPTPCAMLDSVGACRIYAVRPLICRTHGLPMAVQDEEGVYGDICPLSFLEGEGLGAVPSADFLSLEAVNTVLVALNQRYLQTSGADAERVSLRSLSLRVTGPADR